MTEAKYDRIGLDYNLTRKADDFLVDQLISLLDPKGGLYLDIGCGTGNYIIPLFNRGFKCIGIDPSQEMLKIAKTREPQIKWLVGTAEDTSLQSNSIDGVIGSMTIHHWTSLAKGFCELFRVLKPNGKMVIFSSTSVQMKGYWLNHYFPKMLLDSIAQMPSIEQIKQEINNAGFTYDGTTNYQVKIELQDKFLYSGKLDPEFYLKEENRRGISSFSSLANQSEIKKGLIDLSTDIKSGKINKIIESYENELGDYLFIKATKH